MFTFFPTFNMPTTDPKPPLLDLSIRRYTTCSSCIRNFAPDVIGWRRSWAMADACPMISKISETLCWTECILLIPKLAPPSGKRSLPTCYIKIKPYKLFISFFVVVPSFHYFCIELLHHIITFIISPYAMVEPLSRLGNPLQFVGGNVSFKLNEKSMMSRFWIHQSLKL